MNIIGEIVNHITFGKGTVIDQDASEITVKFHDIEKTSNFLFPSCFEKYFTIDNKKLGSEIAEQLQQLKEKEQEQEDKQRLRAMPQRIGKGKKVNNGVNIPIFSNVKSFCECFNDALKTEIAYLKKEGGKRIKITDGIRIGYQNGAYIYAFETDEEKYYPDGTDITIWENDNRIPGKIEICEEFSITVSSKKYFGNSVPSLYFSAEPWQLIQGLIEKLNEMSANPSSIVESLICFGKRQIDNRNRIIKQGHTTAIQMSQEQPITFIWGPPGTGKTETLSKIALKHMEQGNKVLVVSYSNVSVDEAIMRVNEQMNGIPAGKIIRYGYARKEEVLNSPCLTSYNLALHQRPDLLKNRDNLIAKKRKFNPKDSEYFKICKELNSIRTELRNDEKRIVKKADFVATTISKIIVDQVFMECNFDVVIFDEASMAYIPQVIYAANQAKKHFICIGDFAQLPPIVQSSTDSILNGDIFQFCGIVDAVYQNCNHNWLCMLDVQYRMHPDIALLSSHTMYGGRLKTYAGLEKNREKIVGCEPFKNHAIGLADLSGMMSVCSKTISCSRINILSAMITFSLALTAAQDNEVGIITPYHAQSRLLHAMTRDALAAHPNLKSITCATVHQFQGSEKDIIIYDAVDCYRMKYPGKLIAATKNNYANRLFNVAVTRSKGKFICVTNVSYIKSKHISKDLTFDQLLTFTQNKEMHLSGDELLSGKKVGNMKIYKEPNERFIEDLTQASEEICIDIPDAPRKSAFLNQLVVLLQNLKKKKIKITVRAEQKEDLSPKWKSLTIEDPFVVNPVAIIDRKIVWYGMPASNACFSSEGKKIKTLFYPTVRFEGAYTAKLLYGFLGMNRVNKTLKK